MVRFLVTKGIVMIVMQIFKISCELSSLSKKKKKKKKNAVKFILQQLQFLHLVASDMVSFWHLYI